MVIQQVCNFKNNTFRLLIFNQVEGAINNFFNELKKKLKFSFYHVNEVSISIFYFKNLSTSCIKTNNSF